jgi:hypothetical protein
VKFSPLQHGANAGGIYVFFENNTLAWYTMGDVLVKAVILKGGAYSNERLSLPRVPGLLGQRACSPREPEDGEAVRVRRRDVLLLA